MDFYKKVIMKRSKKSLKRNNPGLKNDKEEIKNMLVNGSLQKVLTEHSNMNLQLHQLYPPYVLKERLPKQKGLLINHYMGTGKTLTGLNFMYRFKEFPKIIVTPSEIRSVWIKQISDLNLNDSKTIFRKKRKRKTAVYTRDLSDNQSVADDFDTNNNTLGDYQFFDFENLQEFLLTFSEKKGNQLSDVVLLIDEGHHLVEMIKSKDMSDDHKITILTRLQSFKKIILMTGTPFFMDEYDIVYLINIISGKSLLPYNVEKFRQQYFTVNPLMSAYFGYIRPFFASNIPSIIAVLTFMNLYIDDAISMYKNSTVDSYDEDGETYIISTKPTGKNTIVLAAFLALFNIKVATASTGLIAGMAVVPAGLAVALAVFLYITKLRSLRDIRQINVPKLSAIIGPYVSYYNIPKESSSSFFLDSVFTNSSKAYKNIFFRPKNVCYSKTKEKIDDSRCCQYFDYLEKYGLNTYPSQRLIVHKVPYNSFHLGVFMRMTYNMLSNDEATLLELSKHKKSVEKDIAESHLEKVKHDISTELFGQIRSYDQFKSQGRLIGNLYTPGSHFHKNEKKKSNLFFREIDNLKLGIIPPDKFVEILRTIDNEPAVVYSNFYEKGILMFAKFLSDVKKNYKILTPEMNSKERQAIFDEFKTSGKNEKQSESKASEPQTSNLILLLHPKYTEGISIVEARQLHILEPMENFSSFEQLCARVVRYQSHNNLPPEKRFVTIHQWMCTANTSITRMFEEYYRTISYKDYVASEHNKSYNGHNKEKIKAYMKYSPETSYWNRIKKYDQDITPDVLVYENMKKIQSTLSLFEEFIQHHCIENCRYRRKKKSFCDDMKYSIRHLQKKEQKEQKEQKRNQTSQTSNNRNNTFDRTIHHMSCS